MATDEQVATLLSFIDDQLSRDEALQLLKVGRTLPHPHKSPDTVYTD
jgi:hypothetical protein